MLSCLDVSVKKVNVGDIVAFGRDNGSRLSFGEVSKITPKKVWIKVGIANYNRDHKRVSLIESK